MEHFNPILFEDALSRERDSASRVLAARVQRALPDATVTVRQRFIGPLHLSATRTTVEVGTVVAWCESEVAWVVLTETGDADTDVDRIVFGGPEEAVEVIEELAE